MKMSRVMCGVCFIQQVALSQYAGAQTVSPPAAVGHFAGLERVPLPLEHATPMLVRCSAEG